MRLILLLHRYLAVAIGALMTLWCLSGFVMMYQAYPALTEAERLEGLEPLDLTGCCEIDAFDADDHVPAPAFRVEMLAGDPVLRLATPMRAGPEELLAGAFNLRTGRAVEELTPAQVLDVAREYGTRHGIEGAPRSLGTIDVDQWTVQSATRNQPAYHFAFEDAAGTEIYVSGTSGEVFQDTNVRERVLTWLGAIPHWLYPLQLRQNGPVWLQVVIWTSVLGAFLAATGLYVGISRYTQARKRNRWSPFRGWWYWHHVTGLVFGVLALTWVASGLLTVNPWGALSGGGGGDYGRLIRGQAAWGEVEQFLAAVGPRLVRGEFSQLRSAPFGGRLYVLAERTDRTLVRLDASARPAPLEREQVERAVASLGIPVREAEYLDHEDSFYYGHKSTVELPVYRAILDDAESTRLYVSPQSGTVRAVGATSRLSRWVRTGLHDLDFAGLRVRPVWDIVVILLLAGVTVVCTTGTWMACKRLHLDFRRMRRSLRRKVAALTAAVGTT